MDIQLHILLLFLFNVCFMEPLIPSFKNIIKILFLGRYVYDLTYKYIYKNNSISNLILLSFSYCAKEIIII